MDEVITASDASSSLRSYSESSVLPSNLPLLTAFLSLFIAQFLKVFTHWYVISIYIYFSLILFVVKLCFFKVWDVIELLIEMKCLISLSIRKSLIIYWLWYDLVFSLNLANVVDRPGLWDCVWDNGVSWRHSICNVIIRTGA